MMSFCYVGVCVHLYNYFNNCISFRSSNIDIICFYVMYVRTTMEISACTLLCYPYIFNVLLYTHVINIYVQNTLLY